MDWNFFVATGGAVVAVSLFTREWIEIADPHWLPSHSVVSLFTREWIEIAFCLAASLLFVSPSLRGSGLKSSPTRALTPIAIRLPLYEGVDWNQSWKHASHYCKGLPLYEGVDWNRYTCVICCCSVGLPLYEGVDWNLCSCARLWHRYIVSLFTREWIEILSRSLMPKKKRSLPLYEGVDWNVQEIISWRKMPRSPSLRGSGLKL